MSNDELLKKWKSLVDRIGYSEALALIMATKKVSVWTAEALSAKTYGSDRPSRRTREALQMVLEKKAS